MASEWVGGGREDPGPGIRSGAGAPHGSTPRAPVPSLRGARTSPEMGIGMGMGMGIGVRSRMGMWPRMGMGPAPVHVGDRTKRGGEKAEGRRVGGEREKLPK